MSPLLLSLLISLGIQATFLVVVLITRTDKLTDLVYGSTFIILVLIFFLQSTAFTPTQYLLVAIITLWGIRLAAYLFIRILKTKTDKRFDEIRESIVKLLGFWSLQDITVWVVLIPTTLYLNNLETQSDITNPIIWIGFFVWAAGLIIESVADLQKYRFKSDPSNKGKWINTGLWKYSRHPNYFGEILCWYGVYIFVLPTLAEFWYILLVSPIYITILLRYVSGVPLLEKKYDERYKDNPKYGKYKSSTPILVPWLLKNLK